MWRLSLTGVDMIIQEWVSKEEIRVDRETRSSVKSRVDDTLDYLKMILLLTIVFFCISSAKAECEVISIIEIDVDTFIIEDRRLEKEDGVWFMCHVCRLCQWQSFANANWRGEFFCKGCKTKYIGG